MIPHWMSLYVRVSSKTILKRCNTHLILIILAYLVIGRSRTPNLKLYCFFMGVISFQCGQQDPIHAVHTKITYISFRNICTLFELVNVIFPIKLSFVVFFFYKLKIYIYSERLYRLHCSCRPDTSQPVVRETTFIKNVQS